jgi:uncharacterized protein YaaW (UPF0174 family)
MKVHEILAETMVTENIWEKLFGQGVKGITAAGVKYASKQLSVKYSDELVKAYQLGIPAKPLTAEFAEKFFTGMGLPKTVAQQLASNQKILASASSDAEKIMKATRKKLGVITAGATADKIYGIYKTAFGTYAAWAVIAKPLDELSRGLDARYKIYEKSQKTEKDLAYYQSERQALAAVFVGQVATGLAGLGAARLATGMFVKGLTSFGGPVLKTLGFTLRGVTDASLLYLESNYLNTPEGRKAIAWLFVDSIFGKWFQTSVGSYAVNAGAWLQNAWNKSIEVVNKVPGVNIKTIPGVPVPAARVTDQKSAASAFPTVKPRTSPETWGKEVPTD